jgi:hypothetical protein
VICEEVDPGYVIRKRPHDKGLTNQSNAPEPSHNIYARPGGGRQKKKDRRINVTDMIGTDEDIERRLQEQLEGPKEMFSAEERVRPTPMA